MINRNSLTDNGMRAKPPGGKVGCSSTRFPTPIEHGDSNIAERMLPALQPVQAIAFDSGSPAASSPIWSRLTPAVSMRKNPRTTARRTARRVRNKSEGQCDTDCSPRRLARDFCRACWGSPPAGHQRICLGKADFLTTVALNRQLFSICSPAAKALRASPATERDRRSRRLP